jgi:nitrite reductase (NADH) large subunit
MDGSADERQTLVVVGNGMMGFRLARKLVECGATPGPLRVVMIGEEPRPAYDRVRLTELLEGRAESDLTLAPTSWYEEQGIELHLGDPVLRIDRSECTVHTGSGVVVPYDRLVLATGSRPFVPSIPGVELPGVFVYRTVDDLRAIIARSRGAARAAVIGGGLLGLEAARAVHELGLEVHVLERSDKLLSRQLDDAGAGILRARVEALGVEVHTGARTARIEANGPRERVVVLDDGGRLTVDLVVLAVGIRARDELGRDSGLEVAAGGGVVIDDHLTTSDPRVFAVGECAAHRGITYGLAVPGYRMIDVLVDNLVGGDAAFTGADQSARLKLLGVSVAALGRYREEGSQVQSHVYAAGGVYRKLLLREGRIVGALAVGDWDDLDRVRQALDEPRGFSFWDLRRFRSTGSLFQKAESPPVHEWPAEALVCGCLGIRRGALTEAMMAGCATLEELSARTSAGTMCGSCKPLLVELVRRVRVDSIPPSRRAGDHEDSPPTLRCSFVPGEVPPAPRLPTALVIEGDGAPISSSSLAPTPLLPPPPSRPAVFLSPAEAAVVRGPSRRETTTLASAGALLDLAVESNPGSSLRLRREPDSAARSRPKPHAPPVSSAPLIASSLHPTPMSATSLVPPASSRAPDSTAPVPSSRRDSMSPLRPISVPPSRLSGLPSGRLPPASIAPPLHPERARALTSTAVASLVFAVTLALVPAVPPAHSFAGHQPDLVITQRAYKQATGYATLALIAAGLVLSARKRIKRFRRGDVGALRVLHGALGAAALLTAACHTGLSLGERLNRLLALDFIAASLVGGLAAALAAQASADPADAVRRMAVNRVHLFLLVPFPVLLALHLLAAYYF